MPEKQLLFQTRRSGSSTKSSWQRKPADDLVYLQAYRVFRPFVLLTVLRPDLSVVLRHPPDRPAIRLLRTSPIRRTTSGERRRFPCQKATFLANTDLSSPAFRLAWTGHLCVNHEPSKAFRGWSSVAPEHSYESKFPACSAPLRRHDVGVISCLTPVNGQETNPN